MRLLRGSFLLTLAISRTALPQTPVPLLDQPVAPASVIPGGSGFTLTLHGAGFVTGGFVRWNGKRLNTTIVSKTQATAEVSEADAASAQTAWISLANSANLVSNNVPLQVVAPAATSSLTVGPGYSLASEATGIAAGDFNGDGNLDLAVSNPNSRAAAVQVFLGNGDGTFRPPSNLPYPGIYGLLAADVNNDGKCDLVGAGNTHMVVWLGEGNGTFSSPQQFDAGFPFAVAAADFNGDGKLDVAVANYCLDGCLTYGGLTIMLGNGDGTFTHAGFYSLPLDVSTVVAGDFNGDGIPDLAVAVGYSSYYYVLFGNGDGTFQTQRNSGDGLQSDVVTADFNGDGKLDLAFIRACCSSSIDVNLGNGNGTFSAPLTNPGYGLYLSFADFNGDGKLDLISATAPDTLGVYLGNGDGTFQAPVVLAQAPAYADLFIVGDFNNDGRPDIAVTLINGTSGMLGILLNSSH
jgi:hypothetical protein